MLANILAKANCLCYLLPTDSCEVLTRKLDSFLTKQKKSKSAKNEDHHSPNLSEGAKKRANPSDVELVAVVPNPGGSGSGGDVERRATGGGNVPGVIGRSRKRENDEVSSVSNTKKHKKKRRRTPTPETTSSTDSSDD